MFQRKTFYLLSSALVLLCFSGLALAQTEKKVLYGVLIDNSGSLRSQFDRVVDLGSGVVRQVHKGGPISIFSFKGIGNPKKSPPLIVSGTEWSEDRKSRVKLKDLITELKQSNIQVYGIGLVKELEKEGGVLRKSPLEQAVMSLTSVTNETGGRAIFPDSNNEDVSELLQKLLVGYK
jgi:hypothetical protein